jgi:TonB family protein
VRTILTTAALVVACVVPSLRTVRAQEGQQQAKTLPVLVHEVKPQYTEGAIRRRIQGGVSLSVVVRTDGTVSDVTVVKSLDPELDQQAIAAAKQWTFKPGTIDGKPVNVAVTLELTFTLRAGTKAAPPAQSTVYKPGKDVTAPVLVHEVRPQYTEDAKARRVQGSVEVSAVVLSDGTVGEVKVTKSLDADLDQQAINATKQWTFRPGTKDGKPVDVEVNIELTFTLK